MDQWLLVHLVYHEDAYKWIDGYWSIRFTIRASKFVATHLINEDWPINFFHAPGHGKNVFKNKLQIIIGKNIAEGGCVNEPINQN